MEKLKLLLRLARLHFLVFGFMIYLMGYLLAVSNSAPFDVTKFVFGYAIFGCAQLSVSFSNDYFDRKSDAISVRTTFSGGSKVLVEHPDLELLALTLGITLLAASAIAAAIFAFIYAYSFWFLVFAILGGLLGWFYTAPPLKLAYRKLGEVATVLAVGLMMPGMGYFVAYGHIDLFFAIFVLPLSCYGLLFILTVEMPDIDADRVGKKTNALVKWGVETGVGISFCSALVGTLSFAVVYFSGILTEILDVGPLAMLSVLPLVGAASGYHTALDRRQGLTRQVNVNMTAMVLFVLLLDCYILAQVVILG